MRLYRLGDEGTAIRDIQDRLAALGFESAGDLRGSFQEQTAQAVVSFQKAKGLDGDGIVGPETWRALYEAGYRLGDRLIYMRRPMLNSLGFDSDKADGIFGPDTESAVIDFQRNRNLAEDGKVGPEVVTEIHLVTRGEMKEGRHSLREREWLRRLPPTIAGTRIYLDAGCRDPDEARQAWEAASAAALAIQDAGGLPMMSRSQDTQLPERLRARRANRMGSDLILAFRINSADEDCVFYFASEHSNSAAGEQLARSLSSAVGGRVEGRASSMLKETRAPASVISHRSLDEKLGVGAVEGLAEFFASAASTK
jgi:N-acetylmuramoyl-L-alanine amidase